MAKETTCPVCGKPASRREAPFCSQRCADVDLGQWLTGGYRLPDDPADREETNGSSVSDPS